MFWSSRVFLALIIIFSFFSHRGIPESTKMAIQRLHEKGIKVVVATGRPYNLCEELIALGIDILISANLSISILPE